MTVEAVERASDLPLPRIMSDEHYRRNEAAALAIGPEHRLALVEGVDTLAWTAMTGIPTLFVQSPSAGAPPEISGWFATGGMDTVYLITNGVSVVVTDRPIANPDLHQIVIGVYVLDPSVTARLWGDRRRR